MMVTSLLEHVPDAHSEQIPKGGLNLWLRLPGGTNLVRLTRDWEDSGVVMAAGKDWLPAEPAGPFIRLNCSGPNPGGLSGRGPAAGFGAAAQRPAAAMDGAAAGRRPRGVRLR
jgi:DNA-binding transcriptional MocR family regulator